MKRRMKKVAASLMAIAMAATMITGCGNSASGEQTARTQQTKETANAETAKKEGGADETKAAAKDGAKKVGVVIKIAGNPFYEATDIGFAEAGEELGIDFITNGPSEATVEGQIQIIE